MIEKERLHLLTSTALYDTAMQYCSQMLRSPLIKGSAWGLRKAWLFAPAVSRSPLSIRNLCQCCMLLLAHAASCPSFYIVSLGFSLATSSPHITQPSMILAACNVIAKLYGKHVMGILPGILADGYTSWWRYSSASGFSVNCKATF